MLFSSFRNSSVSTVTDVYSTNTQIELVLLLATVLGVSIVLKKLIIFVT